MNPNFGNISDNSFKKSTFSLDFGDFLLTPSMSFPENKTDLAFNKPVLPMLPISVITV